MNIFYLLAYAWDQFREGQLRDFSATECPDSINLLAYLLATGIERLAAKGVDRSYKAVAEETPRLRGRFDLVSSYQRATHLSGRLVCEFDELTADTMPNQILKSTCERIGRTSSPISRPNRSLIRHSLGLLQDVSSLQLSGRVFRRVQLHRNNRHYRFLLNVCELLHHCYLPTEEQGKGRFHDVLRNERQMHKLFEKFVLRFAHRHCHAAKVRPMRIQWNGRWDPAVTEVLPIMQTDVTIDHPERKTILDCKFYREALVTRDDRQRLHSSHLYQLSAYLQNKACEPGWEGVRGVLLYPAVNHCLDLRFVLLGHPVEIQSIDLDQPWKSIHDRLLQILC